MKTPTVIDLSLSTWALCMVTAVARKASDRFFVDGKYMLTKEKNEYVDKDGESVVKILSAVRCERMVSSRRRSKTGFIAMLLGRASSGPIPASTFICWGEPLYIIASVSARLSASSKRGLS